MSRASTSRTRAYPLGVCAERTTFSRAIAEGYRPGDFIVAAITASPCGGCRQWLAEMKVERVVFRNGGRIVEMTPGELLPEQFECEPRGARVGRRVWGDRDASARLGTDTARFPTYARGVGRRPVARSGGQADLAGAAGAGPMKAGLVAVAGRPNVGKSTLVNALTGEKVAITSTVPNTTRRRIFGVANGDDWQLVLVDLPGFQRPMDALTERMQETVDGSFEDVDVVLLVLSARDRIGAGDRFVARRVFSLGVPVVIALNKIDRLKHGHVASQMKVAAGLGDFHALHPVSAKVRDGIDELRDDLVHLLPEGPALFPLEQTTDLTLEERIAEVIREKALHLTRDEVPHALTVEVDELGDKVVRASCSSRPSPRRGSWSASAGAMIREIGTRARPEVEALVGQGVPGARRQGAAAVAARPKTLERLGL